MAYIQNDLFTDESIDREDNGYYEGKYVLLKPSYLSQEYRNAKWQLAKAYGGFGCDPTKIGTCVMIEFIGDGENVRVERYDVLGVPKKEAVEEWRKLYEQNN